MISTRSRFSQTNFFVDMIEFFSDRRRLIRLAASLICTVGVVVVCFSLLPSPTQAEADDLLCNGKCSTYCTVQGPVLCWKVKCCETNEGGCKAGDPRIFEVDCLTGDPYEFWY